MAADRAATLFMERNMTDKERLPRHVAVIMDGNGRWAQKNKVSRLAGHNAGMLAMKEIIKRADVLGIKYLTVYAFSTENWKRSQEEVGGIFGLLVKYVASELKELNENNVKVAVLGDLKKIPRSAQASIDKALSTTGENDGLHFNIALNYGSRQEIARAARRLAGRVLSGEMDLSEIDLDSQIMYLFDLFGYLLSHGFVDSEVLFSGQSFAAYFQQHSIIYGFHLFTSHFVK